MVGLAVVLGCAAPAGIQVELFAGKGVEEVGPAVEGLRRLEVPITVRSGVTRLSERYLLGVRPGDGEPLDPLRAFVKAHASPDDGVVHLVVLDGLIDPRSKLAGQLSLEGLGLAPGAAHSPATATLVEELGGGFAPLVLVDVHAVDERLLWHELGHVRGLVHDEDPSNVMHPDGGLSLRPEQLEQLRR